MILFFPSPTPLSNFNPQPSSQEYPVDRSTSISQVRNEIHSPLPLSFPTHQASSQDYPVDRSTSISQVRNEMFQQLKKLRSSFQAGQT